MDFVTHKQFSGVCVKEQFGWSAKDTFLRLDFPDELVILVEDLEAVVPAVHHDEVARLVCSYTGGVAEQPRILPATSKHSGVKEILCVNQENVVQAKI